MPQTGRVAPDQGLDGDGVQDLAALAGGQALLGLDRRLQAVRPALPLGHPAPGLVDQLHRAVPHDVVDVALQQRVRVQGHVEPGQRLERARSSYRSMPPSASLRGSGPRAGQGHVAGVVVDLVVQPGVQPGRDPRHLAVGVRAAPAAPGQHQRHPRLVDQDRVGLVDQGHVRLARDQVGDVGDQPVAEHVEADLADRRVGDLRRVGPPPLRRAWRPGRPSRRSRRAGRRPGASTRRRGGPGSR